MRVIRSGAYPLCLIYFVLAQTTYAQASAPTTPPAFVSSTPPPYSPPLQQRNWEQLSDRTVSRTGDLALSLRPRQWQHGETENFILHYRNMGDALEVARQIEFDLWCVAQTLRATKAQYARKSHVYIFQDDAEWRQFLRQSSAPAWVHSFAMEDELFLDIHGTGHGFEAATLAHETTHAVVARIYQGRRWPLWLSEGFAEYMGHASLAARNHQRPQSNQQLLPGAEMSVAELFRTTHYPAQAADIAPLYETAEKFVRYLFNRYPSELFPRLVERLLEGEEAAVALAEVYGKEFSDLAVFEKRFAAFNR